MAGMSAKPPSEVAAKGGYLGWRHNSIFGGGIEALQLAEYPHNTQPRIYNHRT